MRTLMPCLLVFVLAWPAVAGEASSQDGSPAFVVHEWGVLIRGGSEKEPVLASPKELVDGLPAFALRYEKHYKPKLTGSGWNKPVLHFYGPPDSNLSVHLSVAQGWPLAYWPAPAKFDENPNGYMTGDMEKMVIQTYSAATGMHWSGTLTRAPANAPENAAADHWWSRARQVPGLYFNAGKTSERFIFYEATAKQAPVLTAKAGAEALELANAHDRPVGPVLVILNDGQTCRFAEVKEVPANGRFDLPRAKLVDGERAQDKLLAAARAQWQAFGMTEEEAAAIVDVWKEDLLKRPGFLVISRMPPELYEQMFPLEITPKPDKVVRAGAVFDTLPQDDGRLAWLPKLRATMETLAKKLSAEDFNIRQTGEEDLARYGDLARPYLQDLKRDSLDAGVKDAATRLLKLAEPPAEGAKPPKPSLAGAADAGR